MNGRSAETNADLAAAPRGEVLALAGRLAADRAVEHLQLPQEGLWLLRMAEPVRGDDYFIGELPVGQASVMLRDPVHGEARGGAIIQGADRELATAAAVCDAVLAAGWPEAHEVASLAARGARRRRETARMRQAVLDRTRVDFSELGQED